MKTKTTTKTKVPPSVPPSKWMEELRSAGWTVYHPSCGGYTCFDPLSGIELVPEEAYKLMCFYKTLPEPYKKILVSNKRLMNEVNFIKNHLNIYMYSQRSYSELRVGSCWYKPWTWFYR